MEALTDAIVIKGLCKRYGGREAVRGLDLSVHRGELFSLLGVNGAGKTTMVRMLSGLIAPTAGDAWIEGHSIRTEGEAIKKIIGISMQETAVAEKLTVFENLVFMARIAGEDKKTAKAHAMELAERFGLTGHLKNTAKTLSGGLMRRLSIAMALISDPEVLFLDEPTLGLDVLARRELWDVISSLHGRVTVILTTHYMEEAEELSDRIGILADGKLTALGTAEELRVRAGKDRFEDAFVAYVRGEVH